MTASQVELTLRELIPPDRGVVWVDDSTIGPVIHAEPKRLQSATMTFNVSENEVEVSGTVGRYTPIEILSGSSRYSSFEGLDEFRAIAEAVVNNGFVETLWIQWGRIRKSRATITIDGRIHRICNSTFWRVPFCASEKVDLKYEPY